MRPIVFPKWPERALLALAFAMAVIVSAIAFQAYGRFGGEDALTVMLGLLPVVMAFVLFACLVRRHRLKTEFRASDYDGRMARLATHG